MTFVPRRFLGLATGLVVLGTIVGYRRLQATTSRAYEPPPPPTFTARSSIRFEERAAALGLDVPHELYFPNPEIGTYLPLAAFPPALAVADIDDDGWMDLYVVQPKPGLPNRLYRNLGGQRFEDIAPRLGLADLERKQADSMAVFADFDRDGKLDLFQSRFGCHGLYLQDPATGRFRRRDELLPTYCSNPKAVNVADLDHDGGLDLVFGNYYPETDLATYLPLNHVFGYAGANYHGGTPELLLSRGGGRFELAPPGALPQLRGRRAHTTAVGLSDVDGDGFADLYLSNDYTYDGLYLNRNGRMDDVTEAWIAPREHGFSGMNGDFADFDGDGTMGLFVSEMFIPPFVITRNLLWKHRGDHFENVARDRGVGRCGWAWTAKWADFDLDGDLDLFVVNGKARGLKVKQPSDARRSFAFVRNTIATLPVEFRWDLRLYPDFSRFVLSAFQPSCVFENDGGTFHDVAAHAGVTDLEEGQAGALIDYDNDGRMDMVVGNVGGPLLVYHDVSEHPGHWLGLDLRDARGTTPIGAKVWLLADGKQPKRELYPANGFRGQSDPRVIFGLGAADGPVPDVRVQWPDGKIEVFAGLARDRYQRVTVGQGRAP